MKKEDQRIPYLRPGIETVEAQPVVMQDQSAIRHRISPSDANITVDDYTDDGSEDLATGNWGESNSAKQNGMWDE